MNGAQILTFNELSARLCIVTLLALKMMIAYALKLSLFSGPPRLSQSVR